ncbi:MAG: hypothetical protein ACHQPI_14015 [Thermoanaerobaculia bacterium]
MKDDAAALPLRPVVALVGRFVVVVGALAAALLVLDAVPWVLSGLVRGVTAQPSMEAAEAALGGKLLQPAYFPDAYVWPPTAIHTMSRPARAAALVLAPARAGASTVLFVQSIDGDTPLPEALLPAGKEFHRSSFDLDGSPAVMTEVLLPPDGTFHDVSFTVAGRRVVFRFQGDPAEILKMARSLPRGETR